MPCSANRFSPRFKADWSIAEPFWKVGVAQIMDGVQDAAAAKAATEPKKPRLSIASPFCVSVVRCWVVPGWGLLLVAPAASTGESRAACVLRQPVVATRSVLASQIASEALVQA